VKWSDLNVRNGHSRRFGALQPGPLKTDHPTLSIVISSSEGCQFRTLTLLDAEGAPLSLDEIWAPLSPGRSALAGLQ
jgi:hypothetical protein